MLIEEAAYGNDSSKEKIAKIDKKIAKIDKRMAEIEAKDAKLKNA